MYHTVTGKPEKCIFTTIKGEIKIKILLQRKKKSKKHYWASEKGKHCLSHQVTSHQDRETLQAFSLRVGLQQSQIVRAQQAVAGRGPHVGLYGSCNDLNDEQSSGNVLFQESIS